MPAPGVYAGVLSKHTDAAIAVRQEIAAGQKILVL